jgi:hypothetical protein
MALFVFLASVLRRVSTFLQELDRTAPTPASWIRMPALVPVARPVRIVHAPVYQRYQSPRSQGCSWESW